MQINLPEDAERLSRAAGFASVEHYILNLIRQDQERLAIQAGIDAFESGDVQDLEQFDAEFRTRHKVTR